MIQKKMENEEIEILSTNIKVPEHKLVLNQKLKRTSSSKCCFSCNDFLILLGIIFIYSLLFLTRYYILSPIEIDYHYKQINLHPRDLIYIPIVGTNDIHGHFFPVLNKLILNSTKILTYKTGGIELIYSYVNILREEFGKNRVLYFDAGDHYFGAQDSKLFDGQNFLDFFNFVGLNGTTLGNNDYNYPREWIEKKIKDADFPFLVNNIKEKNIFKKKGILGENHETSHLYEIKIGKNDVIKIGVIGITIKKREQEDKQFYDIGNKYTWDNIIFEKYHTDLKSESIKLRNMGANAILVLSSIGLNCTSSENRTMNLKIYNKSYIQPSCDKKSIIYKLINKTQPGVIDAIIAGDSKAEVHHWINNIPIMSTNENSKYINIMYLPFKKINNKFTLVKDEIKIEGPLPLCQQIFLNLKHCEKISKEDFAKSGDLVEYYWHSRRIELESEFKDKFEKYYTEYEKYSSEKVVKFTGFDTKIKVDYSGDSLLGNLFLDVMKNISQADFSISNSGMFKNEITPGILSYIDITNMIHESAKLCITEITGNELLTIIKNVQIGKYAFYPTSGLKQIISMDKKGNKKVIDVKLYVEEKNIMNGTNCSNSSNIIEVPIIKNKTYIMASNSYILSEQSGDDFRDKKVLRIIQNKFKSNKIKCEKVELGVLLVNYFHDKEVVNISQEINLNYPRIVIQKEKEKIIEKDLNNNIKKELKKHINKEIKNEKPKIIKNEQSEAISNEKPKIIHKEKHKHKKF